MTSRGERQPAGAGSRGLEISDQPKGFTLIELMVVIVIVLMLVALVGPNVWHMLTAGTKGAAEAQMANISASISNYILDNRTLPNSLEDLTQPSKRSGQPYIEGGKIPLDPWDQPYQYRKIDAAKKSFEIQSYGEDKNADTDDDLYWPRRDSK